MLKRSVKSPGRRRGAATCTLLSLVLLSTVSACGRESDNRPKPQPTLASEISVGVYGHPEEVAVYQDLLTEFNEGHRTIKATLQAWDSAEEASAEIRAGADLPDVFLGDVTDFPQMLAAGTIQPVSNLLDERGVAYGDRNNRASLVAFSADNLLQCIPFELNPQVMFYNTDLIDPSTVADEEVEVPEEPGTWSFEQFTALARATVAEHPGVDALAVDASLAGLTPYLVSGGGTVFDNARVPQTTTFAEGGSLDALNTVLPVLSDPDLVLSQAELTDQSALERFKAGTLAMMPGTRDLVPELSTVKGLSFDVALMPSVEESRTSADLNGLCISADTVDADAAADVIAHLVDDASVKRLAEVGYMVPANLSGVTSDAIASDGMPANDHVFQLAFNAVTVPAEVPDYRALDSALRPGLTALLGAGADPEVVTLKAQAVDVTAAEVILGQRRELDALKASATPTDTPE